jgi:hypothetical protein
MNYRRTFVYLVNVAVIGVLSATPAWPTDDQLNPLDEITRTFPKSIEVKDNGRLVEFCPDNTCDGFSAPGSVSVPTLEDFAYLYIYYFSSYNNLSEWRAEEGAKTAAERVLSKPEYAACKNKSLRESARCVLLDLSRTVDIKLLSIRYDEGKRNVTKQSIGEQLSQKDK